MIKEQFKNQLSDRLGKHEELWPREWIEKITEIYHKQITNQYKDVRNLNTLWFTAKDHSLGNYGGRNDVFIAPEVSNYFNRLLYGSNIFALDFLIDKPMLCKLKFCDAGAGFGLLSAFLKELGIDCYNYDNFSQLGGYASYTSEAPSWLCPLPNNRFFSTYNIMPSTNQYPVGSEVDILYCADITTGMGEIMTGKPRILMLEHWYTELGCKIRHPTPDPVFQGLEKDYAIVKDYGPLMKIWERK